MLLNCTFLFSQELKHSAPISAPAEAKEAAAVENKAPPAEKPAPAVDVPAAEPQKAEAGHNHIPHEEPKQEKHLQEPTGRTDPAVSFGDGNVLCELLSCCSWLCCHLRKQKSLLLCIHWAGFCFCCAPNPCPFSVLLFLSTFTALKGPTWLFPGLWDWLSFPAVELHSHLLFASWQFILLLKRTLNSHCSIPAEEPPSQWTAGIPKGKCHSFPALLTQPFPGAVPAADISGWGLLVGQG